MANSNVRFYKLNVLPDFDGNKHKGIFVHVAETMHNYRWTPTNHPKEVDPARLLITTAVKEEDKIYLSTWLSKRNITEIASGLWFGGENGWELLSNETNSAAINAAITTKIQGLHADGYAQAEINTATNSSTLTIKGIKEDNGIISEDTNQNFVIAIDGVYSQSNKIATQSTIDNKIGTLDASAFQTVTKSTSGVNTVLTFNGIKEVDGIISQGVTENAETVTVGDAKLKIQIGSDEAGAFEVFSANAIKDSTIKLDGYVFQKKGDVISVITPTALASDNRLVTEKDIASLGGAMHYKGHLTGAQSGDDGSWPSTVAAGDVYIVTTSFTHSGESNPFEVGDMIVFNTDGDNSKYTVVQSNITLGIGSGQIAKNVGNLTPNNMVIATSEGIKTIDITENDLTNTTEKNKRTLSIGDGEADTTGVCHDVTITDALTVIGKPFTETINISSTNRSIEIKKKTVDSVDTGVMVDLVWNTSMDPEPNNQL